MAPPSEHHRYYSPKFKMAAPMRFSRHKFQINTPGLGVEILHCSKLLKVDTEHKSFYFSTLIECKKGHIFNGMTSRRLITTNCD